MRIAIVGSEYLEHHIHEICEENMFPGVQLIQRTIVPRMYNQFEVAMDLERQNVDMIIAGPVDSEILSQYTQIPYFILRPSIIDLMAIHPEIHDYSRTYLVHPKHDKLDLMEIENFIGIQYNRATYDALADLDGILQTLKGQNIDTVIGNYIVTVKAREAGLKGLYYYSKKGVVDTLKNAVQQVENMHREKQYSADLESVLDHTFNGVMTVADDGTIQYANAPAGNILNIPPGKLVSLPLSKILPNANLPASNIQEGPIQFLHNGTQVIGNLIPRRKADKTVGWYFIFENTAKILEMDALIRQSLKRNNFKTHYSFERMIGQSECMQKVIHRAQKFAQKDSTILITGETGTGKEVLAQSIHNESTRCAFPFVAINCGAIPDTLIESELFGYETGSFTGANSKGKAGLIELAHRGSVFLDDIDSISPGFQAKLLRVLQEREIIRIGANNTTPIDVRFIVATNADLHALVEKKQFRQDLYYRLNVLSLTLPPLRERPDDIERMIRYYLLQLDKKLYGLTDAHFSEIFASALRYDYPGNVRELINIVERFASMVDYGEASSKAYVSKLVDECISGAPFQPESGDAPSSITGDFKRDLKTAQRSVLEKYLALSGGNLAEQARQLGIGRTTLYYKLKELDLKV